MAFPFVDQCINGDEHDYEATTHTDDNMAHHDEATYYNEYHAHQEDYHEHDNEHVHTQKQRPRRNAKSRREQYRRSEARMIERMIKNYEALQHRGNTVSKLGKALNQALRQYASNTDEHSNEQQTTRQQHERYQPERNERPRDDQEAPPQQDGTQSRKYMPTCKHFARGRCTFGAHCKFSHEQRYDKHVTTPSSNYYDYHNDEHMAAEHSYDYYQEYNNESANEHYDSKTQQHDSNDDRSTEVEHNYYHYNHQHKYTSTPGEGPSCLSRKTISNQDARADIDKQHPHPTDSSTSRRTPDYRIDNKQEIPTVSSTSRRTLDYRITDKQEIPTDSSTSTRTLDYRIAHQQESPTDSSTSRRTIDYRIVSKQEIPTDPPTSKRTLDYRIKNKQEIPTDSRTSTRTLDYRIANKQEIPTEDMLNTQNEDNESNHYPQQDATQHNVKTSSKTTPAIHKAKERKDGLEQSKDETNSKASLPQPEERPPAPYQIPSRTREAAQNKSNQSSGNTTNSANATIATTSTKDDNGSTIDLTNNRSMTLSRETHKEPARSKIDEIIDTISTLDDEEQTLALSKLLPQLLREVTHRLQYVQELLSKNEQQETRNNELTRQHLKLNNHNKKITRTQLGQRQLRIVIDERTYQLTQKTLRQHTAATTLPETPRTQINPTAARATQQHATHRTNHVTHNRVQEKEHNASSDTREHNAQQIMPHEEAEIKDIADLLSQGYDPKQAAQLIPTRLLQAAINTLPQHLHNRVQRQLETANSDDELTP